MTILMAVRSGLLTFIRGGFMRRFLTLWAALTLIANVGPLGIQPAHAQAELLDLRAQAAIHDDLLEKRLNTLVPALMRETGSDMWILIAREYNEDPVVETMLPARWLSARRRMILVFARTNDRVDRFAVSRYPVDRFFETRWVKEDQPDQWKALADIVAEYDPQNITVNVSDTFTLADGLTKSQYDGIAAALDKTYLMRIKPDHRLAIGWLETRLAEELPHFKAAVAKAHAIIREGFTGGFIKPGKTGRNDLVWWYRQKIRDAGLVAWFHPSVYIQRADKSKDGQIASFSPGAEEIIQRGDLLHVDFGLKYMGYNTDTQQHAYVLRDGETDAPQDLKDALKIGNRLQDILTDAYKTGRSGNAVLKLARARAIAEDLDPSIYTHPIGLHGHGAGATIGLWDQQGGVEGRGDYPVRANTGWSVELKAMVPVAAWGGKVVNIMLEEDAFFDGETVRYLNGRQTSLHLVR